MTMKSSLNVQDTSYQQVLDFWFGEEAGIVKVKSVSELGKKLWFVTNTEAQQVIDETINDRFSHLLAKAENGELDSWAQINEGRGNVNSLLALVIVLDQFTRHIYRNDGSKTSQINSNTLKAEVFTFQAVTLGLHKSLSSPKLCFLLMPLRHAKTNAQIPLPNRASIFLTSKIRLEKVLCLIKERETSENSCMTVLHRFKTATERRLNEVTVDNPETQKHKELENINNSFIVDGFSEKDILAEINLPMSDPSRSFREWNEEPLHETMVEFLLETYPDIAELRENPVPVVRKLPLFISLSGGVDSMVIARLLVHIRDANALLYNNLIEKNNMSNARHRKKKPRKAKRQKSETEVKMAEIAAQKHIKERMFKYKDTKIDLILIAVHIDYGNRPESRAEAEFVRRWCKSHCIIFKSKRIDEFKRGVTPRDLYEKQTREIRFQMYKSVLQEFGSESNGGIFFGHHVGDLQENVISNIMKGAGILDISGMHKVSVIMGTNIHRPLLSHSKEDIYEYSHRHGVPYFKDTTPKWSTRGKLRNNLLPTISQTYGEGFLTHLSALASQSDEMNQLLEKVLFKPFWSKVRYGKLGTIVDLEGYMDKPSLFWRHALKEVCHRMGCGAVHEKPIGVLMANLKALQKSYNGQQHLSWVELKSDNREAPIFCNDTVSRLSLDKQPSIVLKNTWRVSIKENHSKGSTHDNPLDVEEFCLCGEISYTIPFAKSYKLCPNHGSELLCFKKSPKKLRIAIPIIIPARKADITTEGVIEEQLVRVVLSFCPQQLESLRK